jgi:hypothetical protein
LPCRPEQRENKIIDRLMFSGFLISFKSSLEMNVTTFLLFVVGFKYPIHPVYGKKR